MDNFRTFYLEAQGWSRRPRSPEETVKIAEFAATHTLEDTQSKFDFPTIRALLLFLNKNNIDFNRRYRFTKADIAEIRKFAANKPTSEILKFVNSMHRELVEPPNITLFSLIKILSRHNIKYNKNQRSLVTMNTPPVDSKEYSQYKGKLDNRYAEFSSLIGYFRKLNRFTNGNLNIASFPFEYAFEREYINQLKRPVTVWVLENKPLKFRLRQGKKFLKQVIGDYPNCNVMLPLNTDSRRFASGRNFAEDIGYFKWASIDARRTPHAISLRKKPFHVIDLDYHTVYDPLKFNDINVMWYEYLKPGGVLIVAYAYKNQGVSALQRSVNDLCPDMTDEECNEMIATYSLRNLKSPQKNSKEYYRLPLDHGLKGSENVHRSVTNMANNIAQHIVDKIGVKPAFANVYRGGEGDAKSTLMIRLAFVKGEN